MYTKFIIVIPAAYLLGSIPTGLIIAKAHGIDLRRVGSGNIGATNVSRALGRKWAYLCFILDMLKGLIPAAITTFLARPSAGASPVENVATLCIWLAAGCAAVLGHVFPIYLRFKGGKGVATSLGVALGIWPYYTIAAVIAFVIWLAVVLIWRYVSLASIIAAIAFPLILIVAVGIVPGWNLTRLWPLLIAATAIPLMVIIRHLENIKRLIAGTENKISKAHFKTN